MRVLYCILFAYAVALVHPAPSAACSCGPLPGANERERVATALEIADAVFIGEVESIEPRRAESQPYSKHVVRFRVLKVFKGPNESKITFDREGGLPCPFEFKVGRIYLVYVHEWSNGKLDTGSCFRTAPFEHAGTDLRFLEGRPPAPEDLEDPWGLFGSEGSSRLCGNVRRADGHPLRNAALHLWFFVEPTPGNRNAPNRSAALPERYRFGRQELTSKGQFCVDVGRTTRLLVGAVDQDGDSRWIGMFGGGDEPGRGTAVELGESADHTGIQILLNPQPVFTIRGKVLVAEGQLSGRGTLLVTVEAYEPGDFPFLRKAVVKSDGTFAVTGLPKGRYFMRASLYGVGWQGWSGEQVDLEIAGDIDHLILHLTPNGKK